jgi:N-acetylmuramoyl-L-alanine amidase
VTILDRPSPNQSPRSTSKLECIVLHATAGAMPGCLKHLTTQYADPAKNVSAHYLIDRPGLIYRLVPENMKAWHAGRSAYRGRADVNQFSIGIEMENAAPDTEPFTPEQYAALAILIPDIRSRHGPIAAVGHEYVRVPGGSKVCPGAAFDYSRVPQPEVHVRDVRWQAPVRALLHDPDETLGAFLERILTT